MRGVDCVVPNCGHLHAKSDQDLTRAVLRHATEKHPEAGFTEQAARDMVQKSAYDDKAHAQQAR